MLAEVAQVGIARQRLGDERPRRVGQQNLAAVTGGRDPSGTMDVEPDVVVTAQAGHAGVQADSDAHRRIVRPRGARQFMLSHARRRDGIGRGGEDGEEGVALGAHFRPAVGCDRDPKDLGMALEESHVGLAEERQEGRGALDVGEQKGDRAGRQRRPALKWHRTPYLLAARLRPV